MWNDIQGARGGFAKLGICLEDQPGWQLIHTEGGTPSVMMEMRNHAHLGIE
jgi:hypothetical protein